MCQSIIIPLLFQPNAVVFRHTVCLEGGLGHATTDTASKYIFTSIYDKQSVYWQLVVNKVQMTNRYNDFTSTCHKSCLRGNDVSRPQSYAALSPVSTEMDD